jgi:hypothetical protein
MARGHVIVTLDDEDPLTTISLLIRVFKNVQHVSVSDEEHDLFEPDAAFSFWFFASCASAKRSGASSGNIANSRGMIAQIIATTDCLRCR